MASNSGEGFVSYFNKFYSVDEDFKIYLIKGGPGTGKSSFMRHMAKSAKTAGMSVILCPCTSDPDSLDGVIIKEEKIAFLDATAPHIAEPVFPGICENIINLGEFWDSERLRKSKNEIINSQRKCEMYHKTASRYICAAARLKSDAKKTIEKSIDYRKLDTLCKSLAKNCQKPISNGVGNRKICFLCGITPKGIISFPQTVLQNTENVVIISDKEGIAANEIMRYLLNVASANGFDTVALKNYLLPGDLTDGVILPQIGTAFVTETEDINFGTGYRKKHIKKLLKTDELRNDRNRLFFDRRIGKSLLLSAVSTLYEAKSEHDILEGFYKSAMDFDRLYELKTKLSKELFGV